MPIKSIDGINIVGYVSRKGHGIKIFEKEPNGVTRKLRIFSDGRTSSIYTSPNDDWRSTSSLYEESYGFFKKILKKFSKPGNLNETDAEHIVKLYGDYCSKNRVHNVLSTLSKKPVFGLSEDTKAIIKMWDDAHKRALKSPIRYD